MKNRIGTLWIGILLGFALIPALLGIINPSPTTAQGFGNLETQLRHMADQETGKFMDALKVAVLTLDGPTRTTFRNTLVTELGLDRFATDQERVEELSQILTILKPIADNANELFAAIVLNIQITPEPEEGDAP